MKKNEAKKSRATVPLSVPFKGHMHEIFTFIFPSVNTEVNFYDDMIHAQYEMVSNPHSFFDPQGSGGTCIW